MYPDLCATVVKWPWMKRRDLLKVTALGSLAAPEFGAVLARIETEIIRLKLQHTWTTVMSSSDFRDTLYVRYSKDGITGHGEGAPIVRYKEDAKGAQAAITNPRSGRRYRPE